MTDKQMAEKKSEFIKMFAEPKYFQLGTNKFIPNGEYGNFLGVYTPEEVWQWISKLVEEVEDSLVQEFEDCISEELLIDVEKFLDLKDTVETKWD